LIQEQNNKRKSMASTDPNTRPFSLDPKALRTLMREDNFTTPQAMKELGLKDPEATQKLVEMARAGWIEYQGFSPYYDMEIDLWKPARLGVNFALKKLMKRTSVAEGEKVLSKAIAAARKFNAEEHAYTITKMTLFGSLVRGGDDNRTIGDIDLQVETKLRKGLSKEELERRLTADREGTPNNWYTSYDENWWAKKRAIRAIRAVSTRLSASEHKNIEDMGCEHRVIYSYDSKTGTEALFSSELIPANPSKQEEFNRLPENINLPEVPSARKLPDFPSQRPGFNHACPQTALYGWVRGASLEDLAKHLGTAKEDVQVALAAQDLNFPDPTEAIIYPSILETLDRFLRKYKEYDFRVSINPDGRRGTTISVWTNFQGKGGTATSDKRGYTNGRLELIMLGEKIIMVIQRWHASIKRLVAPLKVGMSLILRPGTLSYNIQKERTQDVREIKKNALEFFETLWDKTPIIDIYGDLRKNCDLHIIRRPKYAIEEKNPYDWEKAILHKNNEIAQSFNCFVRHVTGGNVNQFDSLELIISRLEWFDRDDETYT